MPIQDSIMHLRDSPLPDQLQGVTKARIRAVLKAIDRESDDIVDAEAQRQTLTAAGIELTLGDAMPDILLWNRGSDELWVIEAVTSDGEVDLHKLRLMTALAMRTGKAGIGFTTAYQTWKAAAARQARYKNLPPATYLWIMEDPTKHFLAIEPPVPGIDTE